MKYLFSEDIQYVSGRKKPKRHLLRKAIVLLLILAFIAFSVGSMRFVRDTFNEKFARVERSEYSLYPTYADVGDIYGREEVTFSSEQNTLSGYLYGKSNPKGLVVISHGLGGGGEVYLQETMYFVKKGYKVLAYDNTGSYDSEGEGTVGLSQSVVDLDHALDYVESRADLKKLPVYLYGHSWGGYAVCAVLNYDHDIAGVVSISGYESPMEMYLDCTKEELGFLAYLEYPYIWAYQKYLFGGAGNLSAVEGINKTDTPVLLIHGSEDTKVDYSTMSIISHRDEITNPNVEYITCTSEKHNGHSNLFITEESRKYRAQLRKEKKALEEEYDGEVPKDVLDAWYAQVDREKTYQLDEVFMQDVYAFIQGIEEG